ncbi:MAG: hypothetical protein ABSB74_15920 [Tepidisphaeraceae bacterium]
MESLDFQRLEIGAGFPSGRRRSWHRGNVGNDAGQPFFQQFHPTLQLGKHCLRPPNFLHTNYVAANVVFIERYFSHQVQQLAGIVIVRRIESEHDFRVTPQDRIAARDGQALRVLKNVTHGFLSPVPPALSFCFPAGFESGPIAASRPRSRWTGSICRRRPCRAFSTVWRAKPFHRPKSRRNRIAVVVVVASAVSRRRLPDFRFVG